MEKLSRDLEAVLGLAGDRPTILLGHSIGGTVTLTFCRLFPQALRARVRAIALVQTTYTNPVRTTKLAGLFTASSPGLSGRMPDSIKTYLRTSRPTKTPIPNSTKSV
jgi:pimeloyl-ACP methyl ester carboxylesterase